MLKRPTINAGSELELGVPTATLPPWRMDRLPMEFRPTSNPLPLVSSRAPAPLTVTAPESAPVARPSTLLSVPITTDVMVVCDAWVISTVPPAPMLSAPVPP